jgi:hypothetical protein
MQAPSVGRKELKVDTVIGGLKAALHNPHTSDEGRHQAEKKLEAHVCVSFSLSPLSRR